MKKLDITLNLPPGWKLLHASGVDAAKTWIGQWTLLDLFIILIISLAASQLLGYVKGGLALVTMRRAWAKLGSVLEEAADQIHFQRLLEEGQSSQQMYYI